jgi:hypothetical protein
MSFETWTNYLGTSEEDARLKGELAAAGVKKIPKLDEKETSVQFELKGSGLELIMTDEAVLKAIKNQGVGEGPLIVSGVVAKVGKSHGRDVYVGDLPFSLTSDMTRDQVRSMLGNPSSTGARQPVDIWTSENGEVIARYDKTLFVLSTFTVTLNNVKF